MMGGLIRAVGAAVYDYPAVPQDVPGQGEFGRLKVALVADSYTAHCMAVECRVRVLTPRNYREVIEEWRPDLVFVESAFHGADGSWRYRLAKQPRWLRLGPPAAILALVACARDRGVPTVFWNKDDGAFFEDFIEVARAFDYIFTTDQDSVADYRRHLGAQVPVHTLTMPYQPAFHQFSGFHFERNEACFTGSYYRRILSERRKFLDMVFDACAAARLSLNVYDRNRDRLSRHFEFAFPRHPQLQVHGKVPYRRTADIYKQHVISVNVNSVTGSATMVSRRLLEILACGGIAVTNPSLAVERQFQDYCHVVTSAPQAKELFARLRGGPSARDLARAEAGAAYVRQHHTWSHRLRDVCAIVKC